MSTPPSNVFLLSKGIMHFSALVGGKICSILIDEQTKDLELHTEMRMPLIPDNIGTGKQTVVRYRVAPDVPKEQTHAKHCGIRPTHHNVVLLNALKRLHGDNSEPSCWIFPGILSNRIEELEFLFNPLAPYVVQCHEMHSPLSISVQGNEPKIVHLFGVPVCTISPESDVPFSVNVAILSGNITYTRNEVHVQNRTELLIYLPTNVVCNMEQYDRIASANIDSRSLAFFPLISVLTHYNDYISGLNADNSL